MITQILGVALISLLTITPTIQQNNIEQLIAPNIEIQSMNFNTPDEHRLLVVNQFSVYTGMNNTFNSAKLYTNFNFLPDTNNNNITFSDISSGINGLHYRDNITIMNDNLYINLADWIISGNNLRELIRQYYFRTRGGFPTSSTFSFTETTTELRGPNTTYTYSLNGTQGSVNANIYLVSQLAAATGTLTNTNITLPLRANMSSIIQALNPQTTQDTSGGSRLLYYFLSNTTHTTATSQNYNLYALTNFGRIINYGQFTLNYFADTTPPTITGITGNPTNWTNQPVTITVNATDNVGLNATAYSFNGGQTWQQSNQLTTSIMQILEIRVRDTSGNIASQQLTINRIDTSTPAINLAGNWKNTFELGELANNQALLGYLSISDNLSGLNNGLTTISNFNYNQAGSYSNIQVSATDNAGNNFVYTLPTVTITQPADNTGPIITGPTIVNRTEGNITTQGILDLYSITDISGIEPNTISIRDLNNNVITDWSPYTVGSYQLRVYARDTLNNITQYQFTLQVGEAPPPDLTPPTIVGPLLVSFEIGTYTSNSEILNLYTFIDNVGILQNQLIGDVNYTELGDYPVIIRSTDTSNNVTNRNVVVRIRDSVVLGNYNPLTDLLSGIFGGALSMIFTIGTINVLGLRLLDAMGVIILGAVLLFVYKAIKGGS
jgi:hypothetical protein